MRSHPYMIHFQLSHFISTFNPLKTKRRLLHLKAGFIFYFSMFETLYSAYYMLTSMYFNPLKTKRRPL